MGNRFPVRISLSYISYSGFYPYDVFCAADILIPLSCMLMSRAALQSVIRIRGSPHPQIRSCRWILLQGNSCNHH